MEKFLISHYQEDIYFIYILNEDWDLLVEVSSRTQALDYINRYCKRHNIKNFKIMYKGEQNND